MMAGSVLDGGKTTEQELARNLLTGAKCEDGKSVWQATIDTVLMQDTKGKKGDFFCSYEDEGLACLIAMVRENKVKIDKAPLKPFNATVDDLLRVFVKWSRKDRPIKEKDEQKASAVAPLPTNASANANASTIVNRYKKGRYNVSKAFRRVVTYTRWMKKNCTGFDFDPATMTEPCDAWGFFLTHDKEGRLVWWGDIDQFNFDKIKNIIPYEDTLRYFTYISHLFMFDRGAQENGMVCVDQMGNKSVTEYLFLIPMELGAKLDRISVGILPIKMKKMYMYNCARWMLIVAGLMAPFTSAKIIKRVCFIRGNPHKRLEQDLGIENIPAKMGGVQGKAETDILSKLFANIVGSKIGSSSKDNKNAKNDTGSSSSNNEGMASENNNRAAAVGGLKVPPNWSSDNEMLTKSSI